MKNRHPYFIKQLTWLLIIIGSTSCSERTNSDFTDVVKVALRDIGHQLLLSNNDSTSLVKPIISLKQSKYELSFEKPLVIHPDSLVRIVKNSFKKSGLPPHYLTEVIPCDENQVVYSYEMKFNMEQGIIPCSGRPLLNACYIIQVRFTKEVPKGSNASSFIVYGLIILTILLIIFLMNRKKLKRKVIVLHNNATTIGQFKFYPEQNKLIKAAVEISLSKKECELLSIFVANSNQIVKREELTKRVWEDKGVIVGRSLDTYISKLRKKLEDDSSIKLTNVHGVGYKLEIDL